MSLLNEDNEDIGAVTSELDRAVWTGVTSFEVDRSMDPTR